MTSPNQRRPLSYYVHSSLPFSRRYLEAVLDSLLNDFARRQLRPKWWPRASFKYLTQSFTIRRELWKTVLSSGVPDAAFPPSNAEVTLKDEETWHIANYLKRLYETISADDLKPGVVPFEQLPLVELPDDRYQLDLAVSALPTATMRAALPASSWESLLRDLSNRVFTDFLLWLLEERAPDVTVPDIFRRIGGFERRELTRRESPPNAGVDPRTSDRAGGEGGCPGG